MSDREYDDFSRFVVHAVDDTLAPDPHAPFLLLARSPHLNGAAGLGVFGKVAYGPTDLRGTLRRDAPSEGFLRCTHDDDAVAQER